MSVSYLDAALDQALVRRCVRKYVPALDNRFREDVEAETVALLLERHERNPDVLTDQAGGLVKGPAIDAARKVCGDPRSEYSRYNRETVGDDLHPSESVHYDEPKSRSCVAPDQETADQIREWNALNDRERQALRYESLRHLGVACVEPCHFKQPGSAYLNPARWDR